jgi:hypothetical protein
MNQLPNPLKPKINPQLEKEGFYLVSRSERLGITIPNLKMVRNPAIANTDIVVIKNLVDEDSPKGHLLFKYSFTDSGVETIDTKRYATQAKILPITLFEREFLVKSNAWHGSESLEDLYLTMNSLEEDLKQVKDPISEFLSVCQIYGVIKLGDESVVVMEKIVEQDGSISPSLEEFVAKDSQHILIKKLCEIFEINNNPNNLILADQIGLHLAQTLNLPKYIDLYNPENILVRDGKELVFIDQVSNWDSQSPQILHTIFSETISLQSYNFFQKLYTRSLSFWVHTLKKLNRIFNKIVQ